MIISFFGFIVLLIVLTFIWPPDSPWSPWWRTNKKVAKKACSLAGVSKKDTVYELGSGDGEFVLAAAEKFNAKSAVGIEIDYSRYLLSEIKRKLRRVDNAKFIRSDFKKIKLHEANVIYFYLVPRVIERILPKLKKELRPGTKIISYRYEMPLTLIKKKDGLYLYKI